MIISFWKNGFELEEWSECKNPIFYETDKRILLVKKF